jgi:hypothetical protein
MAVLPTFAPMSTIAPPTTYWRTRRIVRKGSRPARKRAASASSAFGGTLRARPVSRWRAKLRQSCRSTAIGP